MYFLEILKEVGNKHQDEIKILYVEANELLSIVVASIKTIKNRKDQR